MGANKKTDASTHRLFKLTASMKWLLDLCYIIVRVIDIVKHFF
jgi:hypothetical protein